MEDNKINKPQLEKGYTKIANDILEGLCRIKLTSYQTRVLFYIFRKTYGYNKKEDWISVNQIAEATGIRQTHVSRAKKELLLRKIITLNGIKIAFQKDCTLWIDIPVQVHKKTSLIQDKNIPIQVHKKNIPLQVPNIPIKVKNIPVRVLNMPLQGNTIDNIQKTITKDNLQKKYSSIKNIDLSVMEEIAEKYGVPVAFVQSKFDDMVNWMAAKGKTYMNYKAALMNWVKSDALKIIQKERQINNKYSVTKV